MAGRYFRHIRRIADRDASGSKGSVLIYVIAVMTVFGLLGAAMVAMFSSATMMSTGTPNYARQARYLADAGARYAVSELRNGYDPDTVSLLNTTDYTLTDAGSFDLNVFGRWFAAAASYDFGGGDANFNIPEGEIPKGFFLPRDLRLLNLEGFRDAKIFGADPEKFVSKIKEAPDMTADPLIVKLDDSFIVVQNQPVLLAVRADNSYSGGFTLTAGSTLLVDKEAGDVFPEKNGAFYIESTLNEKKRYFYEERVAGDPVQLKNISDDLFVDQDDWVALTTQNHIITATGSAGGTAGGTLNVAMDFAPNIDSPQKVPIPPPLSLPPDVAPSDFASPDTATPESAAGAVTVDTTAGSEKITLGGNVASASGAAFFGGDVALGGLDICKDGKCSLTGLTEGIRAFFVFDYTGTGDGFTFTVASGSENGLDAYGATGGALGYAGISPTGKQIKNPKMAVEFDTYTNAGHNDPNNAAWTHRDMMQFVYWGTDAASSADDNIHDEDTGGKQQKWEFTNPWGAIYSTPAVDPVDGAIYLGSLDHHLWAINADGSEKWRSDMLDDVYSSPVIGSDRTVYVGSNYSGGDINAVAESGTFLWFYSVASDVRSSPAIDSNDVLYFGTWVNDPYFYAVDTANPTVYKWRYNLGLVDVSGHVALSPDETTVYFVAPDPAGSTNSSGLTNAFLYALNAATGAFQWRFNLAGPVESSPRVAADGTIYVGSDGASGVGHLFAVNGDGTEKWRYDFTPTNPRTRPAIDNSGTVYIGNDDNYLYAISDEGTGASMKWRFATGGDVRSSPLVHDDGSIWFGSDDDQVYAVDAEGNQLAQFSVGANVRAGLGQGPDGSVYVPAEDADVFAFAPACTPQNIKNRYYTFDDLPAEYTISDSDDWMESGPWAVRIEIERGKSLNARNKYEYTLKAWIRQCQETDCSDILGSYFEDTRVEYAAKDPHLEQTVELCAADHAKLDTFIFGFTQGTGAAIQSIDITDTQLGFIRPGDFVITDDTDWP